MTGGSVMLQASTVTVKKEPDDVLHTNVLYAIKVKHNGKKEKRTNAFSQRILNDRNKVMFKAVCWRCCHPGDA